MKAYEYKCAKCGTKRISNVKLEGHRGKPPKCPERQTHKQKGGRMRVQTCGGVLVFVREIAGPTKKALAPKKPKAN